MSQIDFRVSCDTAQDIELIRRKIQIFFIEVVQNVYGSNLSVVENDIETHVTFTTQGYNYALVITIKDNSAHVRGEMPFDKASLIDQFTVMLSS